jgi:small subunit ribosomal protein S1
MVNRKIGSDSPMPVVDESWWESVLAEEGRHSTHVSDRSQTHSDVQNDVNENGPSKITPNWIEVKDLYLHDKIVNLIVTGSNRGGLLVEGENLYGFVPFSHLVDMAGKVDMPDREKCMEAYIGRTLKLKVIECVPEDGRIVFSERAAQAEPGKRAELFNSLRRSEGVV